MDRNSLVFTIGMLLFIGIIFTIGWFKFGGFGWNDILPLTPNLPPAPNPAPVPVPQAERWTGDGTEILHCPDGYCEDGCVVEQYVQFDFHRNGNALSGTVTTTLVGTACTTSVPSSMIGTNATGQLSGTIRGDAATFSTVDYANLAAADYTATFSNGTLSGKLVTTAPTQDAPARSPTSAAQEAMMQTATRGLAVLKPCIGGPAISVLRKQSRASPFRTARNSTKITRLIIANARKNGENKKCESHTAEVWQESNNRPAAAVMLVFHGRAAPQFGRADKHAEFPGIKYLRHAHFLALHTHLLPSPYPWSRPFGLCLMRLPCFQAQYCSFPV